MTDRSRPVGIDRRILALAVPNMLASVSVPLFGVADTAMIGHLPDVAFVAAVASASAIFDLMLCVGGGFLRMGTHFLGVPILRCRQERSLFSHSRSLAIAGVTTGHSPAHDKRLDFHLGFPADRWQAGGARVGAALLRNPYLHRSACTDGHVLERLFLGADDAIAPICEVVTANVANLLADYALIFGELGFSAMGVTSVAWAIVIANIAAITLAMLFLLVGYQSYFRVEVGLFDTDKWRLLFRTNVHLLGRTLCILSAQFVMLGMVSWMGEVPLAANTIVWQIWAVVTLTGSTALPLPPKRSWVITLVMPIARVRVKWQGVSYCEGVA